ncbi:MAG: glycosyltransferase family 4 protein [Actinomycetota bacterium]|nr:glycosyltransferase family 4 protein [Actinomycetota bacterium]
MTTLRVILDEVTSTQNGGMARYAEDLTRQLIVTAPRGSSVGGIVSASPEADYARLAERLPGLTELYKSPLARRELAAAWQHGFTRLPGTGMVHATSLLAPMSRHDRVNSRNTQIAVTVHDAVAWTDPELLPSRQLAWNKAMTRRAERFADAVVVPTHAVADELAERFGFGDRLRVIGGAPSSRLHPVIDARERRERLGLTDEYLLAVSGLDPRKGLDALIAALADIPDIPLVVVGSEPGDSDAIAALATAAAVPVDRVILLDPIDDDDLAAVLQGASVFVQPSRAEGFGLAMVEAFAFGLPVIHSDAPALVEVAADTGVIVARDAPEGYAGRLGEAIRSVIDDSALRDRLSVTSSDRARAFSWRDAAEKVWQLHADL